MPKNPSAVSLGCATIEDMSEITVGMSFSRLTVSAPAPPRNGRNKPRWLCKCVCGQETAVNGYALIAGNVKSCGCLAREVAAESMRRIRQETVIHGLSRRKTPCMEYQAYTRAIRRCRNKKDPYYHRYGGRGIEFRFSSFEDFFAELGPRPSADYSVDRIDNDGHYERGNVRWATRSVQARDLAKNFTARHRAAQELGALGGLARAAKLSPERRREIARKGAEARALKEGWKRRQTKGE